MLKTVHSLKEHSSLGIKDLENSSEWGNGFKFKLEFDGRAIQ
jgi:hypothetical protein